MRIAGTRPLGLYRTDPDVEPQPIEAVLLDFSNTLFHIVDDAVWLRMAAAAEDVTYDDATLARLVAALDAAWTRPEVARAQEGRDLSAANHRAAGLAWIKAVDELVPLADTMYDLMASPRCWIPYDDTRPVLAALRERGMPVGVVSDIAWDIRPTFEHYGLRDYVDAFALSYELGASKPDPKVFRHACAALGVHPHRTLMVGDTPASDGGAAWLGMRAFVLPAEGAAARRRGLDIVPRLLGP
ncbi:MAG: HAD family hydrolase [Streptosporangiaceae bacterium]